MGTDIHSIVQVQRGQGDWETVGSEVAGDQRVYDAFAILANVRNTEDKPYICKPRGLPKGLRLENWSRDIDGNLLGDHSHSWLTLDELVRFHERVLKSAIDYFGYTPISDILEALREVQQEEGVSDEDVRYVFGFSS